MKKNLLYRVQLGYNWEINCYVFRMALTYYIAAPWLLLGIIDGIMKIQLLIIEIGVHGYWKRYVILYTFLVVTVLTFGIAAFL